MDVEEFREHIEWQLESTAAWRRQVAERFPNDNRNLPAADLMDRLASTTDTINENQSSRYSLGLKGTDDTSIIDSLLDRCREEESRVLRWIGFGFNPSNAAEVAESIVDAMETVLFWNEKKYETRIRRAAKRVGLVLCKSRARKSHKLNAGQFKLLDASGAVIGGERFDLPLPVAEAIIEHRAA